MSCILPYIISEYDNNYVNVEQLQSATQYATNVEVVESQSISKATNVTVVESQSISVAKNNSLVESQYISVATNVAVVESQSINSPSNDFNWSGFDEPSEINYYPPCCNEDCPPCNCQCLSIGTLPYIILSMHS